MFINQSGKFVFINSYQSVYFFKIKCMCAHMRYRERAVSKKKAMLVWAATLLYTPRIRPHIRFSLIFHPKEGN